MVLFVVHLFPPEGERCKENFDWKWNGMIGVVCEYNEREVIQEFFELFKTPWEFYVEDRTYEVVISTSSETPSEKTKVCFVYGPQKRKLDSEEQITASLIRKNVEVNYKGRKVPIYSDVLTFQVEEQSNIILRTDSEVVGVIVEKNNLRIYRVGYNLFEEVRFLVSVGQPAANGRLPTLDVHISMLRDWILDSRVPLVEVPAIPEGYEFIACLTHDIDFVGIKNHKFDHTMWGFLFRASVGSVINFLKGRLTLAKLFCNWKAVISLPLVYAGLVKDFWLQFEHLIQIEKGLESTYYFIPFKDQSGEKVGRGHAKRRAARYDIFGVQKYVKDLQDNGYFVELVYVKVALKTALKRNSERERFVPEEAIREKNEFIPGSFEVLSGIVDKVKVFKND